MSSSYPQLFTPLVRLLGPDGATGVPLGRKPNNSKTFLDLQSPNDDGDGLTLLPPSTRATSSPNLDSVIVVEASSRQLPPLRILAPEA